MGRSLYTTNMSDNFLVTPEMHQDLVRRFQVFHNCLKVTTADMFNCTNSRLVQSDPFAPLFLSFMPFDRKSLPCGGYTRDDLSNAIQGSFSYPSDSFSDKTHSFEGARENICRYALQVIQAASAITEVCIPETVEHDSFLEHALVSAVPSLQGGSAPQGSVRNSAWVFLEWRIAWGV